MKKKFLSEAGRRLLLRLIIAVFCMGIAGWLVIGRSNQTFSGTIEIYHTHLEDDESKPAEFHYILHSKGGKEYRLSFEGAKPSVRAGDTVVVKGKRVDNTILVPLNTHPDSLHVQSENSFKKASGEAPDADLPTTAVVGTRLMAYVKLNFTSDLREPTTNPTIADLTTGLHDYFYEQSYDKLNLVSTPADIYGTFTINKPAACDGRNFKDQGNQKLSAAGVNMSKYQHVIFIIPWSASYCAFGSGTDIGANWVIVNGNRYMAPRVVAHELGHNMGLDHASGVHCRAYNSSMVNALGGLTDCDWQEYFDPYDAMGGFYELY